VVIRQVTWRQVTYEWTWTNSLPDSVQRPPPNVRNLFDFKTLYKRSEA
jgi:hypothetical protein